MTRDYKEFSTGEWYHAYNRGNAKNKIFLDAQDYDQFSKRLELALGPRTTTPTVQGAPLYVSRRWTPGSIRIAPLPSGSFAIAAYCLMPNHFHFLIQQCGDVPISTLLLKVLTSYSMYFNRKYKRVGHVFQDRFKTAHVGDNTYLLHLSAYIHQNPKVAGLVRDLKKWPYSSYPEYLSGLNHGGSRLCETDIVLGQFKSPSEYADYVEEQFEDIRERKDIRAMMIDE